MTRYREPSPGEIDRALFREFIRRRIVTKCRRKEYDKWAVLDGPFVDDWTKEDSRRSLSGNAKGIAIKLRVFQLPAQGAEKRTISFSALFFHGLNIRLRRVLQAGGRKRKIPGSFYTSQDLKRNQQTPGPEERTLRLNRGGEIKRFSYPEPLS